MSLSRLLAWLAFAAPSALVCCAAPKTTAKSASPVFAWPIPPGWKGETLPFPLEFAPDLHYRGVEEVRFEPRFFDTTADTYFTYSFVWLLDDPRPLPPEELAAAMRAYFAGLAKAVGGDKHLPFDPGAFSAHVEAVDDAHDTGVVNMVDAFGDGRRLALKLEAESSLCGGRRVVLVSLSPHAPADSAWGALREQRATFRCVAR